MHWKKKGVFFIPEERDDGAGRYATLPTALQSNRGTCRIYYSGRDSHNRSHVAYFDIDIHRPHTILGRSEGVIFGPGDPGYFDDAGAMLTWITHHERLLYMYYIGWNRSHSVPFRNAIGLAISEDGGNSFERFAVGPVLDRSIHDPAFTASLCILIENGMWRMWYVSCTGWDRLPDGQFQHRYHLKYAESTDGINWQRDGTVCIDFASDAEYAISRPCIVKDGDLYRLWYSYRGDSYRIGYAESLDGIVWTRRDNILGMNSSESGWDSEMVEYPFVFDHAGERYMLYNGNGYGKTGIGYAILQP